MNPHTTPTKGLRHSLVSALTLVTLTSPLLSLIASPASAATSALGTVISKNAPRHTVVVATPSGAVRTLRLAGSLPSALTNGAVVSGTASQLPDGTYKVNSLTLTGHAHSAKVQGTVVSSSTRSVVLSADGSTFALTPKAHTAPPITGTVLSAAVTFSASALDETTATATSQTNLLGLEGVLSAISATSLTLNVDNGAATTIQIPASLTLPSTIVTGTRVRVLVDYSSQVFTLVTINTDTGSQASSGVSQDGNGQSASIEVEGQVVAADATSITIQAGPNATPTVITIPSTYTPPTVAVGDFVHAHATMVAGVLTLTDLKVQPSQPDVPGANQTEAKGVVLAVSATSLTIQPGDNATPVTFVVPSTIDVSSVAVGAVIHAQGILSSGTLTLTSFHIETDVPGQGPGSGGDVSSQVDGQLTAVSPTSLTIQPGDHATPVTIAVPSTIDVSSLSTGELIHAQVTLTQGTLTLVSFSTSGPDQPGVPGTYTLNAYGSVVSVSPTSLVIAAGDHGRTLSVTVPSSVDVSAVTVGEFVSVSVSVSASGATLVSVTAAPTPPTQGQGPGQGQGQGGDH